MNAANNRITLKIFFSYFALGLLVTVVGWMVFSEITSFAETQKIDTDEKNKILKVGEILTLMYETESIARAALQTNSKQTLNSYLQKNDTLRAEIDDLALLFERDSQKKLLDSVKILLEAKKDNIIELRRIKSDPTSEKSLQNAINKFSKIESSLGKLSVEEFVEDPSSLSETNRKNLEEYVAILNKYSPRDADNAINQKTIDSIVTVSKTLLREIKILSSRQKRNMSLKENELLQNELTISQKLRQILTAFETDIQATTSQINEERERAMAKSINVISIAAVIGALLAIAFSILILNDFWKSQRYRKELEKAATYTSSLLKSREQLISSVSHDLRTPLSTILGYTELLDNANLKDKESYYVNNIKSASNYVAKLVGDLLDFSKLEAGKIKIEAIPFRLDKIIIETAESIQSLYNKPIDLIFDIDPEVKTDLTSDPFRIKQILTNLVGNAYKFTEKGYIKISARPIKKRNDSLLVKIDVEDTGIGIAREKRHLIFDEFTQAGDDIEKKYGGTGLGLTISKKMAHLLHGDLFLESKENNGSTFTLQIPLKITSPKEVLNKKQEPDKIRLNIQIVVIDDDPALLKLNTMVLEQQGFTVHAFKNASHALEVLHKITYDVIITDIQMPVMNGFRFLELLKTEKNHSYKDQPVIAITGRHDLKKEYYTKAGFKHVIYKPYEPNALLSVINNVFSAIIPDTQSASATKIDLNSLYDLTGLKKILDNDEALNEIIEAFIDSTHTDLYNIENHIKEYNLEDIKKTAHKMISMFRQIKAGQVVPILEMLESVDNKITPEELNNYFKNLKENINAIFRTLKTPV